MPRPFDEARPQLERQYLDVQFDPTSGLSREELVAALARHRAEHPDEPRIMTRAWLFHRLCSRARIAVEPDDYFADKLEHHDLCVALREEWRREADGREFAGDPPATPGDWTAHLDTGHACPDWGRLMEHGLPGLRDRAAGREGAFYEAVALVYEGAIILARRLAAAL
ncbi:MAG: hypothetical protein KKI08_19950, partial [Armatimonadetes bacterium]|nr:hypothetical protein [Armatimonadota bacterium]